MRRAFKTLSFAYKDMLTRLPTQRNNAIEELLPHNWNHPSMCDFRTLTAQLPQIHLNVARRLESIWRVYRKF